MNLNRTDLNANPAVVAAAGGVIPPEPNSPLALGKPQQPQQPQQPKQTAVAALPTAVTPERKLKRGLAVPTAEQDDAASLVRDCQKLLAQLVAAVVFHTTCLRTGHGKLATVVGIEAATRASYDADAVEVLIRNLNSSLDMLAEPVERHIDGHIDAEHYMKATSMVAAAAAE